jgi:hypothetical protein
MLFFFENILESIDLQEIPNLIHLLYPLLSRDKKVVNKSLKRIFIMTI